jgi:hypothetical protein
MGCRSPSLVPHRESPATSASKGLEPATATTYLCLLIGHEAEPTFFWGGTCRQGDGRNWASRLIMMGDWRDSFEAND